MERSLRRTRGARRGFGTARTGGAVRTDAPGAHCSTLGDKKREEVAFCVRGTNSAEKIMKKTCKSNCITPENMLWYS